MKKRVFLLLVPIALLGVIGAYSSELWSRFECAWLVFGPEGNVRVLVRVDGDAVSLTHYDSGKPTGRKESFRHWQEIKDVAVADPDGKTCYVITGMSRVRVKKPTELLVNVEIKGPINYHQYGDLTGMTGDPARAPLAHFHGPLTVEASTINWKLPPDVALVRGNKPTELRAHIGTMDAKKHCWVVVRTHETKDQPAFPPGVYPVVDVAFPAKNKAAPPIQRRYPLAAVC
jgi:hypothetical protein